MNLRFIWIGLFIAVVSKYLSTGPSPEFRSLFPPLPFLPRLDSSLFLYTNHGRVPRVRSLHTTAAQAGQDVWCWGYVFLCFVFFCFFHFLFFFPFFFLVCGHGMGSCRSLAGSLAADRRPIDPPPIVQLRVIDKARKNLPSPSPSPPPPTQHHQQPPSHPHAQQHESSGPLDTSMLTPAGFGTGPFLQNPYYFMFASLAKPDDDTELHWMKVRSFVYSMLLPFPSLFIPSPGWQN